MNGRLYRLTPAGGKPNHYTDSYASASAKVPDPRDLAKLDHLDVGETLSVVKCSRGPGYELWHQEGTWERVA